MFLRTTLLTKIGYFFWLASLLLIACNKKEITPSNVQLIQTNATGDLQKIFFLNDSVGYIAGGSRYDYGEILRTGDGGKSWTLTTFNNLTDKAIYAMCQYQNRLYGAAFDGKIFWQTSPQNTWNTHQTQCWEWFHGIDFATENKGFIVSGIAFHNGSIIQIDSTGNVGQIDSFEMELSDIRFIDENTGFVCGYGAILKTTDGGAQWNFLNVQGDFFKSICCPDHQNIWSVGYNGSIVHSSDQGNSWTKQRNGNNPLSPRWRLNSVIFKDANTGYAVGDKGLVIQTSNGGKNWYKIKTNYKKDLYSVAMGNNGSIWVVGESAIILKITE